MSYHEVRYAPGTAGADEALGQVIVYVDDLGTTYYPEDEAYVPPEPAAFDFLNDFAVELAEDKQRIDEGAQGMQPEQIENTSREYASRLEEHGPSGPGAQVQDPNQPMPAPQATNVEQPQEEQPTRIPARGTVENEPMPVPKTRDQ